MPMVEFVPFKLLLSAHECFSSRFTSHAVLDEQYLQTPQYGYRKMQQVLLQAGYSVNHKRVYRLMLLIGIEAV